MQDKIIKHTKPAIDKIRKFREYLVTFENKFESDIKELSDDFRNEYGSDLYMLALELDSDEYWNIEMYFKDIFRYSLILSINSFFEDLMNSLCKEIKLLKEVELKLDDLRGHGINRAKLYLVKVCGLEFPTDSHEWKEIKKLNDIRNFIAHTNGDISKAKDPKKIKYIISNTRDLSGHHRIKIEKEYLETILINIESFIGLLTDKSGRSN